MDLFSHLLEAYAHLTYEQLRRETPVRPIDLPTAMTGWLVTRYDDARAALIDPRLSKGTTDSPVGTRIGLPPDLSQAVSRNMLAADPPTRRPAGPHAPAPAGRGRLHRPPHRGTATANTGDHRRAARRDDRS